MVKFLTLRTRPAPPPMLLMTLSISPFFAMVTTGWLANVTVLGKNPPPP